MTQQTTLQAPVLSLSLGADLRAFVGDGANADWLTAARRDGTAIVRCLMTWPPEGRTGLVARLVVRKAGDFADIEDTATDASAIAVTFLADGLFAQAIAQGSGDFYMPEVLTPLITAAVFPTLSGPGVDLYRQAKCQELACELLERIAGESLVPHASTARLSMAEMERLIEARRIVTSRFDEKLTLELIGRAAGLNRAKLTQGFREVFGQTVADCLAEARLGKAAADLRSTSRPVSSIGYGAGYLNNASFARAFTKRFGVCPTRYRRAGGQAPAMAMAA